MKKATRAIDRTARALSYVSMVMIFSVMLWMTADVVGRYAFNSPLIGGYEISQLLFSLLIFCGLAYTGVMKGHIAVELLVERFPRRLRAVLNSINLLIATAFFALMAWQNTLAALHDKVSNSMTPSLRIPIYPIKLVDSLGLVVFCLVLIGQFLWSIEEATSADRRTEEPKELRAVE